MLNNAGSPALHPIKGEVTGDYYENWKREILSFNVQQTCLPNMFHLFEEKNFFLIKNFTISLLPVDVV